MTLARLGGRLLAAASLLAASMVVVGSVTAQSAFADTASATKSSAGTDFWLAFPTNTGGGGYVKLFISAAATTNGTVTLPGSTPTPFTVAAGTITPIDVPVTDQVTTSDGVQDLGIHVTAESPVTVYGLNRVPATTDGYLGLPTTALGTRYRVMSHLGLFGQGSMLSAVGTADGTTVTVTPAVTVGAHTAGQPFTATINAGQVYQLASATGDLTGSLVTSDKPVAVFGSVNCANVPTGYGACDHIVEQMTPTSAWGTSFLSVRLATRAKGDTYRVLADVDGTQVSVGGNVVATIDAGEYYQAVLPETATRPGNEGISIETSKPALVAQYSNGTMYDGVTSDPFMMLIPPFQQYQSAYTFATPDTGFTNHVSVIAPTSEVGKVKLDGANIPAEKFAAIGDSGFSGAQLDIDAGTHSIAADLPIGIFVYGFASADSYGYPGGTSVAPVNTIATVTLSQPTITAAPGSDACATATVLDSDGHGVEGVRVDFALSGANTGATFAVTDASGTATGCITGTAPGTGTLTVRSGTESAVADVTWSASKPSAPTGVQVKAGNGSAVVSWHAPTSGSPTSYVVSWAPASPDGTSSAVVTSSPATISGLSNGTRYTFTIVAENAAGSGPASSPVTATPAGVPAKPDSPTVYSHDGQVALSWHAPASDGGSPVTGYAVSWTGGGRSGATTVTGTSTTIGGLTNGVGYTFTVKAINAVGSGPAVSVSGTPARTAPAQPPAQTPVSKDLQVDDHTPPIGGKVLVTGQGYKPGTTVDLWLHSEPVYLGRVVADANGHISAWVTLPAGVTGDHTVQASGIDPQDRALVQHQNLSIAPAAAPSPARPTPPAPGATALPFTGSPVLMPMYAGLVLVGVGGALLVAQRRSGRRGARG